MSFNRTFLITFLLLCSGVASAQRKTENVILITLDGMRWQEVFGGADSSMMKQQQVMKDEALKEKYWRNDVAERRKALFPFLWTTVAKEGQLYGNRNVGSLVNVTNNQWFSYPGYNEILTGKADDARIHSNDKFYNPNPNVLEFLQEKPGFSKKVAAFTSWEVFPFIINDKRNGIPVNAGLQPAALPANDAELLLNKLLKSVPDPFGEVRLDAFTFYYGLEYMKKNKPRVIFFSFGETDDFAHAGEYGAYLNSAHATDGFFQELWSYVQSDAAYKGKTTLVITVDHGRGAGAVDWKHHGTEVASSDQIWMAVLGPDTAPSGEAKSGQVYQKQVAQTIASLLGFKFKSDAGQGEAVAKAISR